MGISANPKNQIPIGMLITEVTFLLDDSAELFGFWYYKERTFPETGEERQLLLTDRAIGRCRKLRLIGSAKQIEDILLSSEWNPSLKDTWIPTTKELVEQAKMHRSIPTELDRVEKPKGIAIPMYLVIRSREDMDSVLRKLRSRDDEITLGLAPDWDLSVEIDSFLKRQSN